MKKLSPLLLLIPVALYFSQLSSSQRPPTVSTVDSPGTHWSTLAWGAGALTVAAGGALAAHRIKKHLRERPLKMNWQGDEVSTGWSNWIKSRPAALWVWLTNREKKVTELSQQLTDRLDQGEALSDVMVTRKVHCPSILSGPNKPEFFYGYPEVAQRVINHSTSEQINRQSIKTYPDANEPVKFAIYPTSYAPALSLALRWNQVDIARFLYFKKGADPSQQDISRLHPTTLKVLELISEYENKWGECCEDEEAHVAKGNTALHYAAAYKDTQMMKMILTPHPTKQEILEDDHGMPTDLAQLILRFAEIPDVDAQSQRRISHDLWGELGDARWRDRETGKKYYTTFKSLTPLHIAAEHGSFETLQELLKYKPDPLLERSWYWDFKKEWITQTPLEALESQIQLRSKGQPTDEQQNKLELLRQYTDNWKRKHA